MRQERVQLSPEARNVRKQTEKRRKARENIEAECSRLNVAIENQRQAIRIRDFDDLLDSILEFPDSLFRYAIDSESKTIVMEVDMNFIKEVLRRIDNYPDENLDITDRFGLQRRLSRIVTSICLKFNIDLPISDQAK